MKRLLLVLAVGCATASRPAATPTSARAEIDALIHSQYAAVERGDLEAWAAALDENAFLFGSDPAEAWAGRAAILEHLHARAAERMRADVHRSYQSTALHI